ncbi:MAG: hypothetical protein V7629_11395 [Motiliproteus sp.]
MKNGVECDKCKSVVTPRLWHNDMNSMMNKRSNQHICPICGETMYTTGGGLTLLGSIICHLLSAFVIWFMVAASTQEIFNLSNSVSASLAWLVLSVVSGLYIARRFFGLAITNLVSGKKTWQ